MTGATLSARIRPLSLSRLRATWSDWAFAAVLALLAAFLLHEGRGTTFFFDEWSVWGGRYGADPEKWLGPINGHLCAVPILIFTAITKVFGAETLTPFRIAVVTFHLTLLVLLYVLARRRLGGPLALAAVVPLGVVAGGWLVLCMPFTGLFAIGPLIAAAAAYLLLERDDLRGALGACVALVLAMATAGGGLAIVGAFTVYLLLSRRHWRRLWVVAIPIVLYLAWRRHYDVPSEFALWDTGLFFSYVFRGLGTGIGAYTSLGDEFGRSLAVLVSGLLFAMVWRGTGLTRALATFAAAAVGYWALIAIARGPELGPEEVRYVYPDAVLVLMLLIAAAPRVVRVGTGQVVLALGLAVLALLSQMHSYRDQAKNYRDTAEFAKADMFAINTARDVVKPDFSSQAQLSAKSYLTGRKYWSGPPGLTEEQVRTNPEPKIRDYVDQVLVKAFELSVAPTASLRTLPLAPIGRPAIQGAGLVRADGASCWTIAPAATGAQVVADTVVAPRALGGIAVGATDAEVNVLSARYDDQPNDALGSVAEKTNGVVGIPPDDARAPWRLRVTSTAELRLCGLAR